MITSVLLQNWRSHANSKFKFDKGTNVLVGNMGSGKSTTMDAICFSLFGSFPALQQRKLKLDDMIMNKPEEKETAAVETEFLVDNKTYRVKRHLKRGKGTTKSELFEDNVLLEGPNSQRVTERVCSILKMNYDLFSRAIYSEQNNIEYFLEIPKGKRKERIDELLRISKFENARKNLGTVLKRLKDRKDDREKFSLDKDEIKQIPELKKDIDAKRKKIDQKKSNVVGIEKQKKDVETQYTEISKKIKQQKQDASKVEDRVNSLEQEKERLNGILEKNNSLFADVMKKLESLKIVEYGSDDKVRKEIEEANTKINEFTEKKGSLTSCVSDIDDNLTRLKGDKCPVCDSELSDNKISEIKKTKEHDKEQHNQELKKLETQISESKKSVVVKEKEFVDLHEKLEEKKSAEKSMIDLETEIKKVEQNRENVGKQIQDEMKKFDKATIEETKKKIEQDEKHEKELYDKFKSLEKKVELELKETEGISELVKEKEKRLQELEKISGEIEKSKKEVTYLHDVVDSFQIFQKVLHEAQTKLREDFTDNVNVALVDVWRKVYPYGDYTDLKLGIDDSGDYVLQLKTRTGEWINVEGITSGGERSTACLVLRIALSLVLAQNLSWLVLDEPTHNLDRYAVRELARTLKDHLPLVVDQIFIITHDEELENAASGSLYRLERNKEQDEPTRVVLESARN
jgi:exonuclease SbcC